MPTDIELPPRIAFVNMADGKVFFDCHPAEARQAREVIEKMRSEGDIEDEAKVIRRDLARIMANKEPYVEMTVKGRVTPPFISDCFAKMEKLGDRVTHLVMDAVTYAGFRAFDRDIMDMITKAVLLREGAMATLWGALLCVSRECSGKIIFASLDKEEVRFHNYNIKIEPVEVVDTSVEEVREALKDC